MTAPAASKLLPALPSCQDDWDACWLAAREAALASCPSPATHSLCVLLLAWSLLSWPFVQIWQSGVQYEQWGTPSVQAWQKPSDVV